MNIDWMTDVSGNLWDSKMAPNNGSDLDMVFHSRVAQTCAILPWTVSIWGLGLTPSKFSHKVAKGASSLLKPCFLVLQHSARLQFCLGKFCL
jgi:hypothetical protein